MQRLLIALALALPLAASAGCSEDKQGPIKTEEPIDMPPPIEAPERATGLQACEGYHSRVCGCVDVHPDLAEECRLASARPKALGELFAMLDGDSANLGPKARRVTLRNARKTIRMCFEADAALDPGKCPRVTPPEPVTP